MQSLEFLFAKSKKGTKNTTVQRSTKILNEHINDMDGYPPTASAGQQPLREGR